MLRFNDFRSEPVTRGSVTETTSVRMKCANRVHLGAGLVAVGLALGGCSADFLRFDAPAFSLNGDTSGIENTTTVAASRSDQGSAPYDQRTAEAPVERSRVASNDVSNQDYAASPDRRSPWSQTGSQTVSQSGPSAQALAERASSRTRMASAGPAHSDVSKLPSASNPSPSYVPMTTGALRKPADTVVVQPGDTLYQLARSHSVSVAALRQANGLTGNVIRPGQTLVIPGPQAASTASAPQNQQPAYRAPAIAPASAASMADGSYVVRPGDSLYRISRNTGVSVADLKRMNNIQDARALRPGTRLALVSNAPRKMGSNAPRSVVGIAPREATPSPAINVASRTDDSQRSEIKPKTIRTLPIVRTKSPAGETSGDAPQPRILNQRSETPIVTKPAQKVAMVPPAPAAQSKFRWPARGRIIASFNHSGIGEKNDGIKISLPDGTDIGAAEDGVVAYAGSELKGYGNLVLLRHQNGWVSAYAHASSILVARGDRVTRGQVIAKAGRSGDVTQPQLHFELRQGAKPVDPLPHMGEM